MHEKARHPVFGRSRVAIVAAVCLAAVGGLFPPLVPAQAGVPLGQWGALETWPFVAVHSVALRSGDLLVWDGWQQPQPTAVYSPATHTFSPVVNAPDSIFCSGQIHLADGRVMVVGGHGAATTGQIGIVNANVFDPATATWSRLSDMHIPRWYPTLTQLADGRVLVLSGNSADTSHWADIPEIYDPATDRWTLLSGVSTSGVHEEEYPFTYLLPDERTLTIAPSADKTFTLDVAGQKWTPVGGTSGVVNGSSVMYRPGKILYAGGAARFSVDAPAKATSAVLDLTPGTPGWQQTAPLNTARVYHTLTMLADGKVLAVGGNINGSQISPTPGVLPAEIWDPASQTWTTVASMSTARSYHSTAVLQRDGTVLVAGGGHAEGLGDPGQASAQVYSPPYLFKGPRPTITAAPADATYGSSFSVATPAAASIASVNLVSLGADTHQVDMDQHFVPLDFTATMGSLTVTAPAGPADAPPGDYMMFLVDDAGVPSVASFVHLPAAAETPPVDSGPPPVPVPASADPPSLTPAPAAPLRTSVGYWMLGSTGEMHGFGDAATYGAPPVLAPGTVATNFAPTPSGHGYWLVSSRGDVYAYGDARSFGGNPPLADGERVTAVSSAGDGNGYWLFTDRGRAFPYGSAPSLGDMSGTALKGAVVGSVTTPGGNGYYMVAADGGIFAFGDARFAGSMGAARLNAPVVGLAPAPSGGGYWLVAADGGIFAFGVPFLGSMGATRLNKPVTGAVAYGDGYLMVGSDGGIFAFSTKPFLGSLGANPPPNPIVAAKAL
jgi:hypothetical protein